MIKIWIKKLINIPTIRVSFMYILNISDTKSITISVTTIVKITDTNAGIQNVFNCQITKIRKMSAELFKIFQNFCEIILKQFVWMLDVETFRIIMVNIANHIYYW